MSTKQFKMYLDEELVERLENMAEKGGRRSAQQVAEEIILTYLPVWSAVTDATNRAIRFQTEAESERRTVLYAEADLAPVVARIEPPKVRLITPDEEAEARQRSTPRKRRTG